MRGPYISIETKAKMKERTRKSPDLADNAVILAQLFQERAQLKLSKVAYEGATDSQWAQWQKKRALEGSYEVAAF